MVAPLPNVEIRPRGAEITWAALTGLLHRAYAPLLARGLRYHASHQDEVVTRKRAEGGECLVALFDGVLVGTVTAYRGGRASKCVWYAQSENASMGQLAVDPPFQGRGLGAALMDAAERLGVEWGARRMVIDTSEHATDLIGTYQRRGYAIVDTMQWEITNYRSVVMAKLL